jgi:drug/metabolite transporter (DMT)-like permease
MKRGLAAFSSDEVAGLRIFTASLFMLPFALSRLSQVPRKDYPIVFFTGLIGSLIPAFLFAVAQTKLPSAVTGIVNSLTPVFVIMVGAAFYRQKISPKVIIGLLLAFSGTLALILSGGASELSVNSYAGLVILATILYGFNVNILKFRLSDLNPIAVSSISIVLCSPFALFHLLINTDFLVQLTHDGAARAAFGYITVLGVLGTGFALILFNFLIRIATPLFASSVTYLIPIVAVFWGLIDGESLQLLHYASMAIIIGGVYLANKK